MVSPASMDLALRGRTILVARDPDRVHGLTQRLSEQGAEVLVAPVTSTVPPPNVARLDAATRRLLDGHYRWVVITSVNTVVALVDSAARQGMGVDYVGRHPTRWAAVGVATRNALSEHGIQVDLVPGTHSATGLLAAFPSPRPDENTAVLFPQSGIASPLLTAGLTQRGWEPETVIAYHTSSCPLVASVRERIEDGTVDTVVLAAGSAVRSFAEQVGKELAPPIITIGAETARIAHNLGLAVAAVAEAPTDEAIADAVVSSLG
ncbi:MAG: uroporphyrinogen-III synthase [Propionibacteriaceae bacterium]|jgi:uroporphyrinogen-III synthase|nr:uroporphyrinogen-III synthase [Propionibacteriaceae bacterium]